MAIARDTAGTNAGSSTITIALTIAGNNRYLLVGSSNGSNDTTTGVTWNGVAMTQLTTQNLGGTSFMNVYLWGLANPDTGSHNVSISSSGTGFLWGYAMSYTGVNQLTPTDGLVAVKTTGTTQTASITTTRDNDWLVGFAQDGSASQVMSAGANTSVTNHANNWGCWYDTNSYQFSPGSKSCTVTQASGLYGMTMTALSPSSVSLTATNAG